MESKPYIGPDGSLKELSWAEYYALSDEDRYIYDSELQVLLDYTNQLKYQYNQGQAKVIRKFLASGMSVQQIAETLEMSVDEVDNIINGSSLR